MNVAPLHRLTTDALWAATESRVGKIELWRRGFSVLALLALWLARRPRIALVFALAIVALSGVTGHSAAIEPWLATPARSLHLLAGAIWLGGILWLLECRRHDATPFAREASRVSALAVWAVVVVATSGLGMAALFLASSRDIVNSGYGALLLGKIVASSC
jgi:putative copper export protein